MSKLNVVIVSEEIVTPSMGGCGRNHPKLCGVMSSQLTPTHPYTQIISDWSETHSDYN